MIKQSEPSQIAFSGLLTGLVPGQLQSWGLLEVLPLFLAGADGADRPRLASPLDHLKLVRVPSYGTLILQNSSKSNPLIVPMHIGFFQPGAQNHATSRVLVIAPGKDLTVNDAFCIQASQGGLLKEAGQRFIILPLSLRQAALAQRGQSGYSRLWQNIDTFNRRYGIKRGGHLERFLRPYFPRLMRFRHAFELLPEQVGAAYFVAGNLVGVEVAPDEAYWQDIGPILNIYCYGAAALLAERHRLKMQRQAVDLEGLTSLDDLRERLEEGRRQDTAERVDMLHALSLLDWKQPASKPQAGLRVADLVQGEWTGQMVRSLRSLRSQGDMLYLSLFRDIVV